jgi:hypothetical protein
LSGGGIPWSRGGSGGGSGSGGSGGDIDSGQGILDTVPVEKRSEYEAEINNYLEDVVRDFSERDTEKIGAHLETLRQALEKDAETPIELRYGGSIKKHTYVDGLSDVDAIVPINGSGLEFRTPKEVIHDFARKIHDRLPYTEVKEGEMAVTVRFTDGHDVQILPAIRTATGIRVADQKGQKWSNVTNPDRFAGRLTSLNQQTAGKLVRVIRLFKAEVNSNMTGGWQLSGYHVEALAVDAFANYPGRTTYKDMLMHLTHYASEAVLRPVNDTTGQSIRVDDDLGPPDSSARKIVSAGLKRELFKMKDADQAASMKRWTELMGE